MRERDRVSEREREREIYIYRESEREGERVRENNSGDFFVKFEYCQVGGVHAISVKSGKYIYIQNRACLV